MVNRYRSSDQSTHDAVEHNLVIIAEDYKEIIKYKRNLMSSAVEIDSEAPK